MRTHLLSACLLLLPFTLGLGGCAASLPRPIEFNHIVLEEYIEIGQRVAGFTVDVWDGSNWITAARGTTIGRKRVLPVPSTAGSKVRLVLSDCRDTPALRSLKLYKAQQPPPQA